MGTPKYNNGTGNNNQYNFRYYDMVSDPTKSNVDLLVSPDEITMYYKKDTINTTVKITLPGSDNLIKIDNKFTSNTTIL